MTKKLKVIRTHVRSVRFSETELKMVQSKAESAGLATSSFMRKASLSRPVTKKVGETTVATYLELGRVGNNLNQLVKAIHQGQQPPEADLELLRSLLDLLHKCRREIGQVPNDDDEEVSDDWKAD